MYDVKFNDYIEKYKNINNEKKWITIYEENKKDENDIFTFCALIDKEKVNEDKYMKKYEWGFQVNSFGKSGYGKEYFSGKEEIFFNDGRFDGEFEYLVALRFFEKYERQIEINPKLIWYYNLVNVNGNYLNPITDEVVIKVEASKIEVQREYLKDFLCSGNQACVIIFDHRRYFNKLDEDKYIYEDISTEHMFLNLHIDKAYGGNNKYDSCACIIGKTVVLPFKKPRHEDYKYFIEDKEYESFIVAYDEDNDETIEFTCNEQELANYFGANPEAPHFLTPTYFDIKVLDKYKNDPRNYQVSDSDIRFLSEWSIPFNINEENKVVVWLGDLGRIPHAEQKYWRAFNYRSKGGIEKKFFQRQIQGIWTDSSRIESKLVPTINRFNSFIMSKYDDVMFSVLSETDKEIYNTFMIPTNYSITEYQSFLIKLSKLVAESINVKLIKRVMAENYNKDIGGSIIQLREFLAYTGVDSEGAIATSIKRAYDSRNKLAGHSASAKEYNKVWKREHDYTFNSVEDARILIENIVGSLEYTMAEHDKK